MMIWLFPLFLQNKTGKQKGQEMVLP